MKAFLLFVIITVLPVCVFSQAGSPGRHYDYSYLDHYGEIVSVPAQATYMRVYMGLDSIDGFYKARDYTVEQPKLVAVYSFSDSSYWQKEGPAVWFGKQGHIKRGQYSNGEPSGEWVRFYPNGQRKMLYSYLGLPRVPGAGDPYKVNNSWDSSGQIEVADGNGMFIERDDTTGMVVEKGMIKDGLREGLWQFFRNDGEPDYEEVYANGKFIKGIRFGVGEGGAHVTYDSIFVPPGFPGGNDGLAKFLSRNIRYPREAQEQRQTGTVFVRFTVEATGEISHVTSGGALAKSLNEEAIRIVERMPRWIPGKDRGKAVPLAHALPIRFTL